MAVNESECTMPDNQLKIINILYASVSLFSLTTGLISMLINRYYSCHYKDRHKIDPTEGIFFLFLIGGCNFELSESFQWILLLDNSVSCSVLGAVREYLSVSMLVIVACLGTHLLILMTQPKCLRVINEEKEKRYKVLQWIYFSASFLIPVVFVPWPFISTKYGKDVYFCTQLQPLYC